MAIKNVRDRGAVGNPATDTQIINATIQEAVSEGGGVVYFPIGHYFITAPLVIDGHFVHLKGEGWGSIFQVQGDFDSVSINPSLPEQYDNSIEDLRFVEGLKSGGKSIAAQRVAQLHIAGVTLESPFDGIHIHNFNTVKIDRTRIAGPRGTYGCWLTGGGPSDPHGRSDVIDFYDTVFQGVVQSFSALNYADGKILWSHPYGRISLWTVDNQGNYVGDIQHGPFEGFTALNYADGKILWRHTDGRISLWTVDNQGQHVSDIQDFPSPATSIPDHHGLIIDGAVSTISAHKIYFVNVEGAGLWFRNSLGIESNPQFATIYGLEADFPRYEGIRIECGQRFYFTDTLIHRSEQRSNIVILEPVNTVSFKGGFSSGAYLAGMDIFGRQVSVQGMDFLANSGVRAPDSAGIVLEAPSRMVTVCGNKCGDPGNVTQSYGIQINSGADQFVVSGNVLFNNRKGGVLKGAGTGPTKVVANNAPDES